MTDSMSYSFSSLEVTRNPFESDHEDRLHFPGFSPSMFTTPRTPISEKRKPKEFRWSIDQISVLRPADIDEFPNQETSSTLERLNMFIKHNPFQHRGIHGEHEVQLAVDEYFSQDAIVPSPWTPNRSVKHVTFSPLPPHTKYIPNDSSMNSSSNSQIDSLRTAPPKLCADGQVFYNGNEAGERELSISSLRRKLFPQGDGMTNQDHNNNTPHTDEVQKIRSILKHPKSPLVTSSPMGCKDRQQPHDSTHCRSSSPDVSPIKTSRYSLALYTSPMCLTQVLESSGVDIANELDMFPDISPIKDYDNNPHNQSKTGQHRNVSMDGGPLELSALTVSDEESESDPPAKVTMEDLANTESEDEIPAKVTMEDLTVDVEEDDDGEKKPALVTMEDLAMDDTSQIDNSRQEDIEDMETSSIQQSVNLPQEEGVLNGGKKAEKEQQLKIGKNEAISLFKPPSTYIAGSHITAFATQNHGNAKHKTFEADDEVLIVRANAALRRANRFSPLSSLDSDYATFNADINKLKTQSGLDNDISWRPVSMSTPLCPPVRRPRVFGSSTLECDYCPEGSTDRLMSFKRLAELPHTNELGYTPSTTDHHGNRRQPAIEDIIRRNELLKEGLREASTPTYSSVQFGKWRVPRTYPLSYMERKALYGKPVSKAVESIESLAPRLYSDSKRVSWPPSRPFSTRTSYHNNRPVSPPSSWLSHDHVYKVYPDGIVSKMPIPALYRSREIDSGFEDWKKSISRWELSIKTQTSRLKYS
ncbi:predicted protein [Nematostella vectensis]|uniref:Protein aurora borealis n=1 Tax=Nematostella vectensis TaxID=45351 RepID=A7SEM9_NEMVE|nr:predicted protein [Nematostella vectensis]|eukprot:XP_001629905.1 predicted protein [Nematostella vectensis]